MKKIYRTVMISLVVGLIMLVIFFYKFGVPVDIDKSIEAKMYNLSESNIIEIPVQVDIKGTFYFEFGDMNSFDGFIKITNKMTNTILIPRSYIMLFVNKTGNTTDIKIEETDYTIRILGKNKVSKGAILIDQLGTDEDITDYAILNPNDDVSLEQIIDEVESFKYRD